jgi:hypothetical protein
VETALVVWGDTSPGGRDICTHKQARSRLPRRPVGRRRVRHRHMGWRRSRMLRLLMHGLWEGLP